MSRAKRAPASYGDMVRTVVLMGLVVGAFVALLPRHHHDAVKRIDYTTDLGIYRHAAGFTVVAPEGLPATWQPTSFRTTGTENRGSGVPTTMHIGFVTPTTHYAALEETDGPADAFIEQQAPGTHADGTVEVKQVTTVGTTSWTAYAPITSTWTRLVDAKGHVSLQRTVGSVTVVLTGGAPIDELTRLAASLR